MISPGRLALLLFPTVFPAVAHAEWVARNCKMNHLQPPPG